MLDFITKLRYESKLPMTITGESRHELFSSFQKWKGVDFVSLYIYKSIWWSKSDPFIVEKTKNLDMSFSKNVIQNSNINTNAVSAKSALKVNVVP
jgi:hypothetical protein